MVKAVTFIFTEDSYKIDLEKTGKRNTKRLLRIVLSILAAIPFVGECVRCFWRYKGVRKVTEYNLEQLKLQISGIHKNELSFFVQRKWIPFDQLLEVKDQVEINGLHQIYQLLCSYHLIPSSHWLGRLCPELRQALNVLNPNFKGWDRAIFETNKQKLQEMASIDFVMNERCQSYPTIRKAVHADVVNALALFLQDEDEMFFSRCTEVVKGWDLFQSLVKKVNEDLGLSCAGTELKATVGNPFDKDHLILFYRGLYTQNGASQLYQWMSEACGAGKITDWALRSREKQIKDLIPLIQKTYALPEGLIAFELRKDVSIQNGLDRLKNQHNWSQKLSSNQGRILSRFSSKTRSQELANYFVWHLIKNESDVKDFSEIFQWCLNRWVEQDYVYSAQVIALGVQDRFKELLACHAGDRQLALEHLKIDEPKLSYHFLREDLLYFAQEVCTSLYNPFNRSVRDTIDNYLYMSIKFGEKLHQRQEVDGIHTIVLDKLLSQRKRQKNPPLAKNPAWFKKCQN